VPLTRFLYITSVTAGLLAAQSGAPHRTVWDGAYSEAQATRGLPAFSRSCGGCHAITPEGKAPVVGDAFWKSFAQKNVSDLLEFISKYMPNGNPGSLGPAVYEDISAYILKANGFPAGTSDLGPNTSAAVEIIQRDGRRELPANALVRVVGCLSKNGSDWVVTKATKPQRAEQAGGEDASRPLGTRTMQLKYVLTRLDPWAGSRVAVDGLLIGADGVNGLNVTLVNRVAAKCP
jgi:mono/diheme cytochrome c family protein